MAANKKNRFLVQVGDTFRYVETPDVAFFYSEDKLTYLHLFSGKRYIISYSLDQLEGMQESERNRIQEFLDSQMIVEGRNGVYY